MILAQVLVCVAFVAARSRAPIDVWLSPVQAALATLAILAVLLAAADAQVLLARRRMDRTGDPRIGLAALRRVGRTRSALTLAFAACVWPMGWLDAVRAVTGDRILVDEAMALMPVLGSLLLTFGIAHRIDARFHQALLMRQIDEGRPVYAPITAAGQMGLVFRQQFLLVLAPVALVGALSEGTDAAWPWLVERAGPDAAEGVALGAEVLLLLVLVAGMPAFVRLAWGATRLGPGPMRDAVLDAVRRAGGRLSRVYVWRTRGTQVNGAIVGFLPRLRYLMLTDALLESMGGRHLDAVVAHEIAHVRCRHIPWLFAAIAGALLLPGGLMAAVAAVGAVDLPTLGAESVAALVLGVLAFGFASRAYEREADAYAAGVLTRDEGGKAISEIAAVQVAATLGRVAALNGSSRWRWTFRHGSIADRQRSVLSLVGQPSFANGATRRARRVRWLTLLVLASAVGAHALGAW